MKKQALKAALNALWHNAGKYVISFIIAGLLTKHVPGIDAQTAQQIGNTVGQSVVQ